MENKKTKESHSKESITNITIVTGASSGLGKEFARQLFVSMHKDCSSMQELWLLSRSKTNLEQLKQELLTLQQKLYSFLLNLCNNSDRILLLPTTRLH